MSECGEVADSLRANAPRFESFDAALAWVAERMPGEDRAGTIVNNVAWSLYRAQHPRRMHGLR